MWRWITHAEFICCSFDHKSVRGSGGGRVAIECGRSADGEILGANGCECAWCAIGMIGMHASRARSGLSHARAGRVGRHRDGRAGHLDRMDISATAANSKRADCRFQSLSRPDVCVACARVMLAPRTSLRARHARRLIAGPGYVARHPRCVQAACHDQNSKV